MSKILAIYQEKNLALIIKNITKSEIIVILLVNIVGASDNICNLRYKTQKEILAVFHNGSKQDYHFIIKELAEEPEKQFECLGESTEKCITFSVPLKKEFKNDKTITYKINFTDSFRFMSS